MKVCARCTVSKPLIEFYHYQKTGKPCSYCRQCDKERKAEWVAAHPEMAKAHQRRGTARYKERHPDRVKAYQRKAGLRRGYGLTPEQYDEMLKAQDGRCAICGRHEDDENRKLAVDHCHTTGRVRGLLCHRCNRALGYLNDDQHLLTSAINYLGAHT